MKKPKILHLSHTLRTGGVDRMFLATIGALQRSGVSENVGCIVSGPAEPSGPDGARLVTLGAPMASRFPGHILLLKARELMLISAAIRAEDPDVVYSYHGPFEGLSCALAAKAQGRKVVIRKYLQDDAMPLLSRALNLLAGSLSDRVVALSAESAAELRRDGIRRIALIPNGKDEREFGRAMDTPAAKRRLGLEGASLVLGMSGRIHEIKNFELLISALPSILESGSDVNIAIAGYEQQPEYKRRLLGLAASLGVQDRVIFLGHRDDMPAVLSAFDIFVHPSRSEACSGAVIEAMFAGLPIVGVAAGSTTEQLEGCGILVRPESGELAAAVLRLIRDPALRTRCGAKALAKARKAFSSEKMVSAYEALFLELAGRGIRR